ncbi:diguanylate cyclase [Rhodopila sp.]|uniref:sensor domain-containing diguanylate cyclase n=1 Tax=Rhodopila sp. TaxID=2480087 RepID=UPI003D11E2BB
MSEMLLDPPAPASPQQAPHDPVRDALMESRQRWRHLVGLATDLAFETDAQGHFVFMTPDTVLGWPSSSLIGQSADRLIDDDATIATINPFCPAVEIRRHRAWLCCADGRLALVSISAVPLRNAAGQVVGARGAGIDVTDSDIGSMQVAGRLRRGQVLHYILTQVKRETEVDAMMDAGLGALVHALGAEGAVAIGAVCNSSEIGILHEYGAGAAEVLPVASKVVANSGSKASRVTAPDGRSVLAIGCDIRSGLPAGLAVWRAAGSCQWDQDDIALAGAAVCIVRMVLEHEALQREITLQARTDPLTGLLNRRAFLEEMRRQIARLDRQEEPGTLMFVDMDAFKLVNDRLGHGVGDEVLVQLADVLRKLVRPFDLITRLGGDEFAVWLSGADHMTAAERADYLCKTAPQELQALLPEAFPKLGVSVGIATRRAGSHESIEELTRRADMAMYEVKRSGRRHWRVSLLEGD